MPKSSFVDFKAIKAALQIEKVLERYGLLDQFKRSGDSLSGPCPIHKGSNPTQFRVSVSKNIFHCFSECKGGGNVLDFIARMERVSVHAAALKAIEWFGLDTEAFQANSEAEDETSVPPTRNGNTVPKKPVSKKEEAPPDPKEPNKPLKFRLDKLDRNHPFLSERGLTLETIIDFGMGFCAKGMMAGRIAIPIQTITGDVVADPGRWPGEPPDGTPKYKLPQGFRKSLELFNAHRAFKESKEKALIIVEGFFDCMKLHQNGYHRVVAIMGSTVSNAQEEIIRANTDRKSQVILMLDEDEAGRATREDIAVRLAKFVFVRVHVFDQEGKQPEDLTPGELTAIVG